MVKLPSPDMSGQPQQTAGVAPADDRIEGPARRTRLPALLTVRDGDPGRAISIGVLAVACAAFSVWLLNLDRGQWFVTDEWDYLTMHGGTAWLGWLFRPHNEHTIVFTKTWFQLLLVTVGIRHYALYMIPLVVAHVVVVAAVYRLTWLATASRVTATGTALATLAMGAGWGTLTWAGQLQVVGSVAAGLAVLLLALEGAGRRLKPMLIAVVVFGTLNGSAFIGYGLAAVMMFARRRLWTAALIVLAIPIGWQALARLIWHPHYLYAAKGAGQVLREGPGLAYAVLDTAVSQTFGTPNLTAALLVALALGALALMSPDITRARTSMTAPVIEALALATVLSMLILVVGRLGQGVAASAAGGYSYMFLSMLLPLIGIMLGHVARSRVALVVIACFFGALSLVGVANLSSRASGLASWKQGGESLTQTAAALLGHGLASYPEQVPVPDTAPTVGQEEIRSWASAGRLDAVDAGAVESDQVSLNVQWRVAPAATNAIGRRCRALAAGQAIRLTAGSTTMLRGVSTDASVDIAYLGSGSTRRFAVPLSTVDLQSLSGRPATMTVASGEARVCGAD